MLQKVASGFSIIASIATLLSLGALGWLGLLSNKVPVPLWFLIILVLMALLFLMDIMSRFSRHIKLTYFHRQLLEEFAKKQDKTLKEDEIYSILSVLGLDNPAILKVISDLRQGGYVLRKNRISGQGESFFITDKGVNLVVKDRLTKAEKEFINSIMD